jgi:hypothetical protein
MDNKNTYFTVPCSVAKHVIGNRLEKCFSIFLYLKSECNGIINEKEISKVLLSKTLGIKDKRTIVKHLKKLQRLNWIGYNKKTGNYFIRGFMYVKGLISGKSNHGIKVSIDKINQIKYQLCAGLMQFKLEGLKRSQIKKVKSKVGSSALKSSGALQMAKELGMRNYLGLSNTQLAELFNCSKSEANRIKLKAEKYGFIKTFKKLRYITSTRQKNFLLKGYSNIGNRIRVTQTENGRIKFYEQLTDEIHSFIYCKKM